MHYSKRIARLLVAALAVAALGAIGPVETRASTDAATSTDMLLSQNQMRFAVGSPPSPVPAGTSGPYGYAIMAVWSGGRSVDLRGASITANGTAIPFYIAPQQFERDYIVLVPQQPLPSAVISVRMDVTVAGQWTTEQWSFSTAGAAAAPSYHSAWVTESAWPTISVGQSPTLAITFRNT